MLQSVFGVLQGQFTKLFRENLNLGDSMHVRVVSSDPTSSAVDAPQGSLIKFNNQIYMKTDNGSSTNSLPLVPYEVKNALSSTFALNTAGYASGEWAQMSGNSINVGAGTWEFNGAVIYNNTGNAATRLDGRYATANGNNTTTAPTALSQDAGLINTIYQTQSTGSVLLVLPMPTAIASFGSATDVYCVPNATFSTAGSGILQTQISARRLSY